MESHTAKRWNPVRLPSEISDECRRFAQRAIDAYAAGMNAASRAVSTHGAEENLPLWIHAREAECAFCIYMGLDPMIALRWGEAPDPGWDVKIDGRRYDIKAITSKKKYLVWPIGKNHIFESKLFDYLVLVSGDGTQFTFLPDSRPFTIEGWVSKARFRDERYVAGPGHPLDAGTWHMHKDQLERFTETPIVPDTKRDRQWFLDHLMWQNRDGSFRSTRDEE